MPKVPIVRPNTAPSASKTSRGAIRGRGVEKQDKKDISRPNKAVDKLYQMHQSKKAKPARPQLSADPKQKLDTPILEALDKQNSVGYDTGEGHHVFPKVNGEGPMINNLGRAVLSGDKDRIARATELAWSEYPQPSSTDTPSPRVSEPAQLAGVKPNLEENARRYEEELRHQEELDKFYDKEYDDFQKRHGYDTMPSEPPDSYYNSYYHDFYPDDKFGGSGGSGGSGKGPIKKEAKIDYGEDGRKAEANIYRADSSYERPDSGSGEYPLPEDDPTEQKPFSFFNFLSPEKQEAMKNPIGQEGIVPAYPLVVSSSREVVPYTPPGPPAVRPEDVSREAVHDDSSSYREPEPAAIEDKRSFWKKIGDSARGFYDKLFTKGE